MIFPGQGLQKINKLISLNKKYKIIQNTFHQASECLKYDLWGKIKKFHQYNIKIKNIQPLIFTASVSIYKLWKFLGGKNPKMTSGHSLGEYAALVCGGVINFSDTVKLLQKREYMMQKISQKYKTSMEIIFGLNKTSVNKIIKKHNFTKKINISSINANKQIVITGFKNEIKKIIPDIYKKKARIMKLPIKIAGHFMIMKKVKRNFSKKIKKIPIKDAKYSIINSITVKKYNSKSNLRKSLINQLFYPVQWKKTIDLILKKTNIILEIGTNDFLIKSIQTKKKVKLISINNIENINTAINLTKKNVYEKK
ncbi:acyltransferase domain-containing protein [Buchnera aphidicola]|uniref:acyltransferase domain-containing protein n=1 Tax=Buchnera aphidicola TaxID=9 RepID=UPI0031B87570